MVLLASCTEIEKTPRPDNFYGDDKMADIMTDLYLMESSMTTNRRNFTDLKMLPNDYIYKKYGTDSVTFKENLYYYSDRHIEYKELMVMVEERLNILKDTVAARQKKQLNESGGPEKKLDTTLILDPDN